MDVKVKELINLSNKLNTMIDGFDEVFLTRINTLTIKDRIIIYLFDGELSPYDLIKKLGLAKSNLALITASLIKEGLISKKRDEFDKRNIIYNLTENGKKLANKILETISQNINKQQSYKQKAEEINELAKKLNELLD